MVRGISSMFLCILLISSANAQFKGVRGGLAFQSSGNPISGPISLAGGGVILRGISIPSNTISSSDILDVNLIQMQNNKTQILLKANNFTVSYSAPSWLIRDAAILVMNETNVIYRNVNLLDNPTFAEIEKGYGKNYFLVQISDCLIGTLSGETLLFADIVQTDPEYYTSFKLSNNSCIVKSSITALNRYKFVVDSLVNLIDLDLGSASNWTYTDEKTKYSFTYDLSTKSILFHGHPYYSFLDVDMSSSNEPILSENKIFSNYFRTHYQTIENLNPTVFSYVVQFAQVSSFFRYLKNNQGLAWSKLCKLIDKLPKSVGNTPRIIEQ